eukprot:g1244.t1
MSCDASYTGRAGTKVALLSDLGGTNARFELWRLSSELTGTDDDEQEVQAADELLAAATYATASAQGFEGLVERFLQSEHVAGRGHVPDLCACAVCGPIIEGEAYCASAVLDAPWRFDEASVSAAAGGARALLLNDFVAVGHALPELHAEELHTLHEPAAAGRPASLPEREPIACLGPGTGLGQVFCVWDEASQSRKVLPSEGCMSEFVPKSQTEWDFNEWLRPGEEGGYVSIDRVVSGQGIASWYEFLSSEAGRAHRDGSPAGAGAAKADCADGRAHRVDPLCVMAIDRFLDTLGSEAGNMAMRYVARGGVYIAGGGICGKLLGRMLDGRVTRAYLERGPASEIVAWCPLYVSGASDLGLAGAKAAARALIAGEPARVGRP